MNAAAAPGEPVLLNVVHASGVFRPEDCDRVVATAARLKHDPGQIDASAQNADIRDSTITFLTRGPETAWIYERMNAIVAQLNGQYWRFELAGSELLQVSDYGPEQHYTWHTDLGARGATSRRKLSISVQLSDPASYDGGTFESFARSTPLAAPRDQGAIIAFPSYVLHRVTPVTRGVRRSLVCWYVGRGPLR